MAQLTPLQKLERNAAIARSQYLSKQTERQQAALTQQQFLAENLGWDATRGAYQCRLQSGEIVYADSITTGVPTGLVSLYRGGGRPVIDSMP